VNIGECYNCLLQPILLVPLMCVGNKRVIFFRLEEKIDFISIDYYSYYILIYMKFVANHIYV
jgi:hypothetical protein